jgi:probable selenium-dependent hydroxylase accessory protein YqeC
LQAGTGKAYLDFMMLKEALGLGNEKTVSLIGAGGKTTTLYCLAHELWQEGNKVLVTTTTRIFKPSKPHVHKLYLAREVEALINTLSGLTEPLVAGVGYGLESEEKLVGLPLEWFDRLADTGAADRILIEADGAKGHHFKVPLEYEPVIPEHCAVTVWIMSIKAVSQPIMNGWVHRADRAAALLGVKLGTRLTEEHILNLFENPQGCLKGVPPGSRKIALINQVDDSAELEKAAHLGRAFLQHGIGRVVLTSYLDRDVVKEVITD